MAPAYRGFGFSRKGIRWEVGSARPRLRLLARVRLLATGVEFRGRIEGPATSEIKSSATRRTVPPRSIEGCPQLVKARHDEIWLGAQGVQRRARPVDPAHLESEGLGAHDVEGVG
jgi:hypothetical protein